MTTTGMRRCWLGDFERNHSRNWNPFTRRIFKSSKITPGSGYRVLSAKDGAEAVTLFRQHQGKIQVAIIDMMMPIMDGPMTIQVLQRIDPAVKIIGVSGLGSRSALTEAGKLQVRAFLEKPYTVDALLTTLHQVVVDNGGEE